MLYNNLTKLLGSALFMSAIILGCESCGTTEEPSGGEEMEKKVRMHSLSDAEGLTPFNTSDNGATLIFYNVFQTLIALDYKTYEIIPVLATERPVLSKRDDGKLTLDFEIRKGAKWDNGENITGKDIEFSLKVVKNPKTDCKNLKPYFEKVEDIVIDDANPRKFTIIFSEPYMIAEQVFSDLYVVPEYVYDPEKIMSKFSVKELTTNVAELENDPDIIKFANFYNSPQFQRETVVGSGAYKFNKWETNQRIELVRKENWWGDKYKEANHWFESNTETLIYETVNDFTSAITALKNQDLDVMHGMPPKDLVELRSNQNFTEKFNTFTPPMFSYDYMGINMKKDKFADRNTREALAHIMHVEQLIETFCYGLGERVASFTHPSIKKRLNPEVSPYAYDLEKAKELLKAGGWGDANGDGTLDKSIDDEQEDFVIELVYNNGNPRREKTCLIFQEAARKVGIKVDVRPIDWTVLLDRLKKHEFDMYVGGWISSPLESDPKQIWHSSSYNGGSNYVGFGTDESDLLIETINNETDEMKRNELYKKLHKIIHDEVPYVFLLAQKERIAINRKYENAYASGFKPGYWAAGFQISSQAIKN